MAMNLLNEKYCVNNLGIPPAQFELPEKVLQFGTGVLLRGLPDFLIDNANQQGVFNGRIVVVKSTGAVEKEFSNQDYVYSVQRQGIVDGGVVTEKRVITAISRVLSAQTDWDAVLVCASNPHLEVIISNTTEAGLAYVEEDILADPPKSFPAKLTAFLYERYRCFDGANMRGLTIIPTELVVNNGHLLRGFVMRHAEANALPRGFFEWLEEACDFCDSLVDRIVPGAPAPDEKAKRFADWGYEDQLCIDSEPFALWAIEGNARVRERLSFASVNPEIIVTPDITPYREQKLRILNGGHTISVSLAYLAGLRTVGDMMQNDLTSRFVEQVIATEILPTVVDIAPTATAFAQAVLDRFRNPFIVHKLINITLQNASKMQSRNGATIARFYEKTGQIPQLMALGFAGIVLFAKPSGQTDGRFFGETRTTEGPENYPINDEKAAIWAEHWAKIDTLSADNLQKMVAEMLQDTRLFEGEWTKIPAFATVVGQYLHSLIARGVKSTLEETLAVTTA